MLLLSLFIIAGCNSKNDNEESKKDNSQEENTNNQDENDSDSSNEILGLGDTGTLETVIGDYEVIPESFEIVKDIDGITPTEEGDVFVIVDITVKNIGDTTLNPEEVTTDTAVLLDKEEYKYDLLTSVSMDGPYDEYINIISEEIQPDEVVDGQLLYALPPTNQYSLVYGWGLDTTSNEVTWRFDADEAK